MTQIETVAGNSFKGNPLPAWAITRYLVYYLNHSKDLNPSLFIHVSSERSSFGVLPIVEQTKTKYKSEYM